MRQSVDFALDGHGTDAEHPPTSWAVAVTDDCDDCDDVRVELTLEAAGERGRGLTAHLSPDGARRLRAALAAALRDIGEPPLA